MAVDTQQLQGELADELSKPDREVEALLAAFLQSLLNESGNKTQERAG